jgi:hypothetical protein
MRSTLVLLLALLVCLVGASYAWLADFWSSGEGVLGLSAGDLVPPEGVMWLYDSAADLEAAQPGGWVQHTLTPNDGDGFLMQAPGVEQTQTEGAHSFALRSLHLGTVDNLVTLSEDNTVVLRFAFDSTLHGNGSVEVLFTLGGTLAQSVQVYDKDGAAHTDAATIEALELACASSPFLQYAACIDTRAIAPDDAEFSTLAFGDHVMAGERVQLITDAATAPEGAYYVYVSITPNLTPFTAASEALNRYMPCTLLFDTLLVLDVH